MKYMFADILKTLIKSLPIGLVVGAAIVLFKRLMPNHTNKSKIAYALEVCFWSYAYILIYKTVLSRGKYEPLSEVFGGWTIFLNKYTGLDYQVIGNVIMFIPFALFLSAAFFRKNMSGKIFIRSALCSFSLSLLIEILQLIFSRGTFQLSDIVYNTLGGIIGAGIFILIKRIYKIHKRKKPQLHK